MDEFDLPIQQWPSSMFCHPPFLQILAQWNFVYKMILPLHRPLAVAVEVTGLLGGVERPEDAGEDEAPLSFLITSSTILVGAWGHLRKPGEEEVTV